MAKKRKTRVRGDVREKPDSPQDRGKDASLVLFGGARAKWGFFVFYFLVTVFLFRGFLFSDGMLFGSDTMPDGIYTRKYYKEYHAEYGGVPKWNPYVLGGLPFVDAMHGDTFYPAAWLKFYMPLTRALGHKLVWHVFLAGVTMYIFLRSLRLRRDAAFLGGLMYMLAPSFVTLVYPAHDAKMYVIAWLPLAFALLESGMNRPRLVTFAGLGGVMGLLVLTSHAQMAYYSYWAIGAYFLFRLFSGERGRPMDSVIRAGLFIAAVVVAVALGAVQLFPAYKFSTTQSVRTGAERTRYEYATSWSLHPEEVMGMVVPSFQGNTFLDGRSGALYRTDHYWGRNPFKLNSEYHGILPLLFAAAVLVFHRGRRVWFFLGLALFSLVYALGANTPFYRIFYTFIPGVKNFRAPSMMIFLFCFAVVTMAADFLSSLFDGKSPLRKGDVRVWYVVGALFFAALMITLMGDKFFAAWRNILYRDISEQKFQLMLANIPVFVSDMWRIVILACVSLGGIWMYLSGKTGSAGLVVLLSLVTVVDQSVVDARFITTIDPDSFSGVAPDRSVRELREKLDPGAPCRTLAFLPSLAGAHQANYYAMFGIQLADGFHNNELRSYELFRGGGRNFLRYWFDSFTFNRGGLGKNNFLRVAGVRYVLIPTRDGGIRIEENDSALGRAFIVHGYTVAENDSAAVEMLGDASFDPSKTVILETGEGVPFDSAPDSGVVSKVRELRYTKDGVVIDAEFGAPGFLVLSDNYVPYWRAYVDGDSVRIYRADCTFMAVACPAGRHEISFVYRSGPYETGRKLTLASLVFVVVSLVASGVAAKVRRGRGDR